MAGGYPADDRGVSLGPRPLPRLGALLAGTVLVGVAVVLGVRDGDATALVLAGGLLLFLGRADQLFSAASAPRWPQQERRALAPAHTLKGKRIELELAGHAAAAEAYECLVTAGDRHTYVGLAQSGKRNGQVRPHATFPDDFPGAPDVPEPGVYSVQWRPADATRRSRERLAIDTFSVN
jgi:hypothetical protein